MDEAAGSLTVVTPNHLQIIDPDLPVIYLGGPIDGADDWQQTAISLMSELAPFPIIIANPRSTMPGRVRYEDDIAWALLYQGLARRNGCVLFWFPCRTIICRASCYASTSRQELAEHVTHYQYGSRRLAVGVEPGFDGGRYLQCRHEKVLDFQETLAQTCHVALSVLVG